MAFKLDCENNPRHRVIVAVFSILVAVIVIGALFGYLISGCDYDNDYFKKTGWNCDNGKFISHYDKLYRAKLGELKEKYSLNWQEKKEMEYYGKGGNNLIYFLYSEEFTIKFDLYNYNEYGHLKAYLYYYGDDAPSSDYNDFKPIVELYNEFINFVSYDAIVENNRFESLYEEAKNDDKGFASIETHFDQVVGGLGYRVALAASKDTGGYYYMAEKNDDMEKENYCFTFDGLLKPIE